MLRSRSVRVLLASTLSTLALVGCSTDTTTGSDAGTSPSTSAAVDADAFPVTIDHTYGATTIDAEPKRVVTIGTNDADNLLALGVVPIGTLKISWGGNDRGSTPWFDDKLAELGADLPPLLDDSDGTPIDEIAKLAPDLILATNSGITQEEYDKLSKIAPTVAYPGAAWVTSWQDTLELDGEALGRSALAAEIEQQTEDAIAKAGQDNPQIVGKTFIFGALSSADLSSISYYTPEDSRPKILAELGMKNAPIIEQLSKPGEFYGTVSAERAPDLASDVFITYAETAADATTFQDDKLIGQIPAIKSGHLFAAVDKTDALSITIPSPLSVPYLVEHVLPNVVAAVDGTVTVK